jgi:hypothetical protein
MEVVVVVVVVTVDKASAADCIVSMPDDENDTASDGVGGGAVSDTLGGVRRIHRE